MLTFIIKDSVYYKAHILLQHTVLGSIAIKQTFDYLPNDDISHELMITWENNFLLYNDSLVQQKMTKFDFHQ